MKITNDNHQYLASYFTQNINTTKQLVNLEICINHYKTREKGYGLELKETSEKNRKSYTILFSKTKKRDIIGVWEK